VQNNNNNKQGQPIENSKQGQNNGNGNSNNGNCGKGFYTNPYEVLALAVTISFLLTQNMSKCEIATLLNLINLVGTNLESFLAQQDINSGEDIISAVGI